MGHIGSRYTLLAVLDVGLLRVGQAVAVKNHARMVRPAAGRCGGERLVVLLLGVVAVLARIEDVRSRAALVVRLQFDGQECHGLPPTDNTDDADELVAGGRDRAVIAKGNLAALQAAV